jgi:DNA-binding MarR family transcriptional regulator
MDSQSGLFHPVGLARAWRPRAVGSMKIKASDRSPAEYDGEDCLRKDNFLPHLLTVANNGYAWHASRMYLEVLGLGVNETRVLSILYEFGELQAWEICDILSMNKATVSQAMKRLEKDGLVEIARDRRGRHARPTPKSLPIHRQIVRMARSREEVLLDGFSPEERAKFREFLARFTANLPELVEYTARHFLNDKAGGNVSDDAGTGPQESIGERPLTKN